jgi:hypothetical protein
MHNHDISRRRFLHLSLQSLLSLGLISIMPWKQAEASYNGMDIAFLRQLITKDSRHSRLILWQSSTPMEAATIQCRPAGKLITANEFPAASLPFSDGDAAFFLHIAAIKGLSPHSTYQYRIAENACYTDWYPLYTEDGGSFQALIFPDSQCSDGYATWRNIAQDAAASHPDAAFYINMGDLVDNGEDAQQWHDWFSSLSGIEERLPFAPVMGNHAAYDLNWQCRLPAAWLAYFPVPANNIKNWDRYWYSFDFGPVHFIVLNNLMDELDKLKPGLLQAEIPWLRADAAASRQKWTIVLMHKDIINYDSPDRSDPVTGDIDPVGRTFMPLFEELGIDVVLTAHQHTYRRLGHIFRFKPAQHGPYYIDTGNAGNCYYDVPINQRFDRFILPQPERGNYLTLTAADNELVFRCFLPNSTLMDTVAIKKHDSIS